MKKKFLALIVCVSLALVGCGSTASNNAAAETSKETTVAQTETVTKEEPKVPEKVEAKTEEKKEDKTTEAKKTEEKTEESKAEESKAEASTEASTEVQEKTEEVAETAPAEEVVTQEVAQNTEPTYATVIEKYIADGDFTDYEAYGAEMGASKVWFDPEEWNFDYTFDGFVISVGTNVQDPEYSYVGIKQVGGSMEYAALIPYKNVPTVKVSSSGTFIPVETAMKLEQTIIYMKAHPDVTQKPDIPGMDWQAWSDLVG